MTAGGASRGGGGGAGWGRGRGPPRGGGPGPVGDVLEPHVDLDLRRRGPGPGGLRRHRAQPSPLAGVAQHLHLILVFSQVISKEASSYSLFLTKEQRAWVHTHLQALKMRAEPLKVYPEDPSRKAVYKIIEGP